MKNETSPEEYWAAVEEEIGEPVRSFALARLEESARSERPGLLAPRQEWGLVFITETTLYIERGASENWIQRLMATRRKNEAPERKAIPLDKMTRVTVPPPKSGLRRLLAAPEVVVGIEYDGDPGILQLILDRRGDNDRTLIDLLSAAGPEKRLTGD